MPRSDAEERLVGTWVSDPDDAAATDEYGEVLLDFSDDGRLTYTVHEAGKRQIMLLTYRVEGDVLVTDQPSDPREERTRLEFTPSGKLVLLYETQPSTYIRVTDRRRLPLPVDSLN